MPNYYLLIVNDVIGDPAFSVLCHRLKNKIWGMHKKSSCSNKIKISDQVIFYIAGRKINRQCCVASAIIKDINNFKSNDLDKFTINTYDIISYPTISYTLSSINIFKNPINLKLVMNKLELFNKKNHNHWGIFLQGGGKELSANDYNTIVSLSK